MQKFLLASLLFGLMGGAPALAQLQKGTTYWGGTLSLNGNGNRSHNADNTSIFSSNGNHTLAPELQWGTFLNPTTMVGIGTRYSLNWNSSRYVASPSSEGEWKSTQHSVQLLPYLRKYKALNERWALFLHGEAGAGYIWYSGRQQGDSNASTADEYWRYTLSIQPGAVYFFPKHGWAIEGYADILSLNASFVPSRENVGRSIEFRSGFSTGFPRFITVRIAKYIPTRTN
jgi:hypothetical protein